MIGIYKYTNNINHKVYIGQSINLEQRKAVIKVQLLIQMLATTILNFIKQ